MSEMLRLQSPSSSPYGEEINELITRPPSWIISWGMSLYLIFIFLIGAACWMIAYPDIVAVPVSITSSDPPRGIISRSEGKIKKLLVADGQQINVGQPLAFCESIANPYDVSELEKYLQTLSKLVQQKQWQSVYIVKIDQSIEWGELQTEFQVFSRRFEELRSYLDGGFYPQKQSLLSDDMRDLVNLEHNLIEQQALQNSELEIAKNEFLVHEKLYKNKVISNLEFEREKAKLLLKRMPTKNMESQLIQNRLTQIAKQKEILELENVVKEQRAAFLQVLMTLQSSVRSWKQKYVIESPISGRVAFSAPWSEQQHISPGQELFKIEPKQSDLKGIVKIGQLNFGKILIGQRVRIKLDGYPYSEFGIVDGLLSNLSPTPGADSLYWGYISLPNQLKTRYGKTLTYRSDMKGTAEIITKDRNIINRLLNASNILN